MRSLCSLFSCLAWRRVTTQRMLPPVLHLPKESRTNKQLDETKRKTEWCKQGKGEVFVVILPRQVVQPPEKQFNGCVWNQGSTQSIMYVESPVTPYMRAVLNHHALQPHALIYNSTKLRWKAHWSAAWIRSPCLRLQCKSAKRWLQ